MMTSRQNESWDRNLADLLAQLTDVEVPDMPVQGLALDSRLVREGALFLATKGLQRHGLEFAGQAWAAGAAAIAYEASAGMDIPAPPPGALLVEVPDLRAKTGEIAARFYSRPSETMPVVGLTGTNGKTTTAHLIARASRFLGLRCGYMGTLGFGLNDPMTPSALTTPDVIAVHQRLAWLKEQGAERVAMEVSSHALDQGRVDAVRFGCAVFTNLSRDHLDYHRDLESYGAAKRRLFETPDLAHAVINTDDAFGRTLLDALPRSVQAIAVGRGPQPARRPCEFVRILGVGSSADGLHIEFDGSLGEGVISSPLLGPFNASNLLQAMAVLKTWGVATDDAAPALGRVAAPAGRMEAFGGNEQPLVVVDFAHTPDALAGAVDALRAHCRGVLFCVFGCGGDRDRGKRPDMARAASAADRMIITDDNPRHEDPEQIIADIVAGLSPGADYVVERDRERAIALAIRSAKRGDVVLVAGKGHEPYQLIEGRRLPLSDRECVTRLLGEAAS